MSNDTFPSGLTKYNAKNLLDWQKWLADNEALDQFIAFTRKHMIPVGTILQWSSKELPDPEKWGKYEWCDGGESHRIKDAELWQTIGTTFGSGDGKTTFNRPDMRGRFPLGSQLGFDANLGQVGGSKTHTLALNEMAKHVHDTSWGYPHNTTESGGYAVVRKEGTTIGYSGFAGSGQPHNNMPPYLTLSFIIKT